MLDYMPREIFGLSIASSVSASVPSLPRLYTASFDIEVFTIGTAPHAISFIGIGSKTRPELKMLVGAMEESEKETGLSAVAVSPSLDYWQKERLTVQGYSFIQDERNAYLPFAGLALDAAHRDARPSMLSPQAQRVAVNLIEGHWDGLSAGELAERLGKSRASVSKYLAEIEAVCAPLVSTKGRSRVLCSAGMGRSEILDSLEPYLSTPVVSSLRIPGTVGLADLSKLGLRIAGIRVLESQTDLAHSLGHPTLALPQANLNQALSCLGEDGVPLPWWDEDGIEVEVWRYWDDYPSEMVLPAVGKVPSVGALSLYLSLVGKHNDDVRLVDAVDQLREAICQQ